MWALTINERKNSLNINILSFFQLLETAETTSSDVYGLHDKIDRKKKVEQINEETQSSFQLRYQEEVTKMQTSLSEFVSTQKKLYDTLMEQSS